MKEIKGYAEENEKDDLFNRVENPYRITEPQMNAISSMDCTGSVPLGPDSEKELEAYLDVYQFESQSCPAKGTFTGAANQESEGMKDLMGIPSAKNSAKDMGNKHEGNEKENG